MAYIECSFQGGVSFIIRSISTGGGKKGKGGGVRGSRLFDQRPLRRCSRGREEGSRRVEHLRGTEGKREMITLVLFEALSERKEKKKGIRDFVLNRPADSASHDKQEKGKKARKEKKSASRGQGEKGEGKRKGGNKWRLGAIWLEALIFPALALSASNVRKGKGGKIDRPRRNLGRAAHAPREKEERESRSRLKG